MTPAHAPAKTPQRKVIVIRLLRPAGNDPASAASALGPWRGQVLDVTTGQVSSFQGLEALCEILTAYLEAHPAQEVASCAIRRPGLR